MSHLLTSNHVWLIRGREVGFGRALGCVLSEIYAESVSLVFFRPPATRVSDKVMIPQDEYPEINFVGLLIGPR